MGLLVAVKLVALGIIVVIVFLLALLAVDHLPVDKVAVLLVGHLDQ